MNTYSTGCNSRSFSRSAWQHDLGKVIPPPQKCQLLPGHVQKIVWQLLHWSIWSFNIRSHTEISAADGHHLCILWTIWNHSLSTITPGTATQHVTPLPMMPASHMGASQCPSWEKQRKMAQAFGPCQPQGRPGWSYWHCCQHLGSETADRSSLSLFQNKYIFNLH